MERPLHVAGLQRHHADLAPAVENADGQVQPGVHHLVVVAEPGHIGRREGAEDVVIGLGLAEAAAGQHRPHRLAGDRLQIGLGPVGGAGVGDVDNKGRAGLAHDAVQAATQRGQPVEGSKDDRQARVGRHGPGSSATARGS